MITIHDLSTTLLRHALRQVPDDAATIFGQSKAAGFFVHLEGFPDDQASAGDPELFRKFFGGNRCRQLYQFEGYPGVTVEEIKKALKVRNAFSNMLDEMQ